MIMAASAADEVPAASLSDSVHVAQKIGKRKRSADAEATEPARPDRDGADEHDQELFQRFLADLSTVLQERDPIPSILQRALPSTQDATPSAKRAKLSKSTPPSTIESKIASGKYQTIDELSSDIASTVASASSDAEDAAASELKAFERFYNDLVARQSRQEPDSIPKHIQNSDEAVDGAKIKTEVGTQDSLASSVILQSLGPGGRPYFSSIKRPGDAENLAEDAAKAKEVLEGVLPKTVSVAAVGPVHGFDSKSKGHRVPTLGEICPPSARLPAYKTPHDSGRATTRGSMVGWYKVPRFPPSQPRGEGRLSYSKQRLAVGSWLTTNNPPPPPNDTLNERRRQRERALSAGTQRVEQTADELAEARVAQEKYRRRKDMALFKSVFSSFAPTYDNSKSVVPQEVTSRLWWNKKYDTEPLDESDFDTADEDQQMEGVAGGDEDSEFADAVANYTEDPWVPATLKEQDPDSVGTGDKEIDELLQEISAMLETLSSYQRRRHSELKASARPALAEIIGTPSNPAPGEVETHQSLRDQLATIIEMLPPFAVARLNGDQLEELSIKTSVPVETVMHKGLLDDETRRAPPPGAGTATAAIRNPATGMRAGYMSGAATSALRNSISTPSQAPTFHANRPLQTPGSSYSSYQPPQQGSGQRSSYQFVQTPGSVRQISQVNGVRPSSGQGSFASYIPNAAMTPQPGQPQRPAQPNFAPRPQQPAGHAPGYTPQGSPQAQRQSYATPNPMSPPRQQYQQQTQGTPVNNIAMSNGVGTVGYHIQLSAEERARLLAARHASADSQPKQPQGSPSKGSSIAPAPASSEASPLPNGHPPSQPQSIDPPLAQSVTPTAQAATPPVNQEAPKAQVNGTMPADAS